MRYNINNFPQEFDPKYSTSRCYEEFGYKCANAFYMPCVQNYDKSGKPIAGEEKSCPNKFKYVKCATKLETMLTTAFDLGVRR